MDWRPPLTDAELARLKQGWQQLVDMKTERDAAAHTAALAAQNAVYRATPRPDGEGDLECLSGEPCTALNACVECRRGE